MSNRFLELLYISMSDMNFNISILSLIMILSIKAYQNYNVFFTSIVGDRKDREPSSLNLLKGMGIKYDDIGNESSYSSIFFFFSINLYYSHSKENDRRCFSGFLFIFFSFLAKQSW